MAENETVGYDPGGGGVPHIASEGAEESSLSPG
jgi:hypothetical protein